jgi:cell division protein ZipA
MDNFGATALLMTVGGLFAVGLLLDVVRRVRNRRYQNIAVSKQARRAARTPGADLFADPLEDDALFSGGDPGFGKSRVVGVRDDTDVSELGARLREQTRANATLSAFREPSQSALALDGERQPATASRPPQPKAKPVATNDAEMVIVHLLAERGTTIAGSALRDAILAAGLRYGEMKIFHFHCERTASAEPELLFSLANAVNPGSFDLRTIDSFTTPGVTLFLNLSEVSAPVAAFDTLIGVVDQLATALGLQVYDESRSSMTRQTIDHSRQRARSIATARERSESH